MSIFIISILVLLTLVYALWYYVFNIYEVRYEINQIEKFDDDEKVNVIVNEKLYEVKNIPINLMGKKVPLRKLDFDFEIIEGASLVEIQPRENKEELFFRSLKKSGKVIFIFKNKLSLFPQIVEFELKENE